MYMYMYSMELGVFGALLTSALSAGFRVTLSNRGDDFTFVHLKIQPT